MRVVRHRIAPARWPAGRRLRIVMVADLHACDPWMPMRRVEAILARAQGLGGDLIALLGDYPGHLPFGRPIPPATVAGALAGLSAPLGVFAVFGNHDWNDHPAAQRAGARRTRWHEALEAAGVATLVNHAALLDHGGVRFALAGIESQEAYQGGRNPVGGQDLGAALGAVPVGLFTVLLAHEPRIFPELPARVDLTLSGHTHGGQILVLGQPLALRDPVSRRFAHGHHELAGRHLVVSGGLGCSRLPLRIGVPPELTVVDLGEGAG